MSETRHPFGTTRCAGRVGDCKRTAQWVTTQDGENPMAACGVHLSWLIRAPYRTRSFDQGDEARRMRPDHPDAASDHRMIVALAVATVLRPEPVSRSEERKPLPSVPLSVTAYCSTGSRNAAGKWPTIGTAAADAYPLGTRLHVAGIGVVTVEDRSAVGATDVDVFEGSDAGCEARAIAFGRRTLDVRRAA